jgi:hypothetical protein
VFSPNVDGPIPSVPAGSIEHTFDTERHGAVMAVTSVEQLDEGLPSSWEQFQAFLIEGLADRPPGLSLAEDLLSIDLAAASAETRVDVLIEWDRMESWVAAQKARATAAVAGPEPDKPGGDDWPRYGFGAALAVAPGTAHHRIVAARALTGRLTDTLAALAAGRIR